MKGRLNRKDYETVLRHYNIPYKKDDGIKSIRHKAEDILMTKLCRCIKHVSESKRPDSRKLSIPVCKRSVIHRHGITDSGFSCKGRTIKLRRRDDRAKSRRRT